MGNELICRCGHKEDKHVWMDAGLLGLNLFCEAEFEGISCSCHWFRPDNLKYLEEKYNLQKEEKSK